MWINLFLLFSIHVCLGLWVYDKLSHWIVSHYNWSIKRREWLMMVLPAVIITGVGLLFSWCVLIFGCLLPFHLCGV